MRFSAVGRPLHIKNPLLFFIILSLLIFSLIVSIDHIFTVIYSPEIILSGSLSTELGGDLVLIIPPNSSVTLKFDMHFKGNGIVVIPNLYDIYGVSPNIVPDNGLVITRFIDGKCMGSEITQWLLFGRDSNSYGLIIPGSGIDVIEIIFNNPTNNTTYLIRFNNVPKIIVKSSVFNFIYAINYEYGYSIFFLGLNILQEFYVYSAIISIIISLIITYIYILVFRGFKIKS